MRASSRPPAPRAPKSSAAISPAEARERLKGAGKDRLLARASEVLSRIPGDDAARRAVMQAASGVIDRVATGDAAESPASTSTSASPSRRWCGSTTARPTGW